jgi:hypothetical protein
MEQGRAKGGAVLKTALEVPGGASQAAWLGSFHIAYGQKP